MAGTQAHCLLVVQLLKTEATYPFPGVVTPHAVKDVHTCPALHGTACCHSGHTYLSAWKKSYIVTHTSIWFILYCVSNNIQSMFWHFFSQTMLMTFPDKCICYSLFTSNKTNILIVLCIVYLASKSSCALSTSALIMWQDSEPRQTPICHKKLSFYN